MDDKAVKKLIEEDIDTLVRDFYPSSGDAVCSLCDAGFLRPGGRRRVRIRFDREVRTIKA